MVLPKIKKLVSEYYGILIISVLIWYAIESLNENSAIDQNKTETYGMVYRSQAIYKQQSKRNYLYEFKINGIKYLGSSPGYGSQDIQVGHWYKVEFSENDPEKNRMNFKLEYYPILVNDSLGKVVDTIFSLEDSFNEDEMNLRINRVKSVIDSLSR